MSDDLHILEITEEEKVKFSKESPNNEQVLEPDSDLKIVAGCANYIECKEY